jgi:hypothetical protein
MLERRSIATWLIFAACPCSTLGCAPASSERAPAAAPPPSEPEVVAPVAPAPPSSASAVSAPAATAATATATATATAEPHGAKPDCAESVDFEAEQAALAPRATGPATGGPRGTRPCAFHESVDTYERQCVAKLNPDGSVSVTAKGTRLNPDNGFSFTLHGPEHQWVAEGTLDAFARCAGPFVAPVVASIDHGVMTYELRFKGHCMIVVR